jgi:lipid-binding SYLF domain-containing protein
MPYIGSLVDSRLLVENPEPAMNSPLVSTLLAVSLAASALHAQTSDTVAAPTNETDPPSAAPDSQVKAPAVESAAASPSSDDSAGQGTDADARAVIAKFKEKNPGLGKFFDHAQGYAVFPTVGKGGIGIGGARGKGYVYQHRKLIGRSTLTQVTVGLQLGGQAYSEIVFLEDAKAMESFKHGRLKLDAQASAIAITARAAIDLGYRNGVAIVTMAKGGLMYEASVGGQKFSFHPL